MIPLSEQKQKQKKNQKDDKAEDFFLSLKLLFLVGPFKTMISILGFCLKKNFVLLFTMFLIVSLR